MNKSHGTYNELMFLYAHEKKEKKKNALLAFLFRFSFILGWTINWKADIVFLQRKKENKTEEILHFHAGHTSINVYFHGGVTFWSTHNYCSKSCKLTVFRSKVEFLILDFKVLTKK